MHDYVAPGVFVEDVSTGSRPIEAVSTSTAAFFGVAPNPKAAERTPTALTNFTEFLRVFADGASGPNLLATAIAGFFQNGGSYCYVVNLGPGADKITPEDMLLLDALEGISLVVAPGYVDADSYDALIGDCERRDDRFAIVMHHDAKTVVVPALSIHRPSDLPHSCGSCSPFAFSEGRHQCMRISTKRFGENHHV